MVTYGTAKTTTKIKYKLNSDEKKNNNNGKDSGMLKAKT